MQNSDIFPYYRWSGNWFSENTDIIFPEVYKVFYIYKKKTYVLEPDRYQIITSGPFDVLDNLISESEITGFPVGVLLNYEMGHYIYDMPCSTDMLAVAVIPSKIEYTLGDKVIKKSFFNKSICPEKVKIRQDGTIIFPFRDNYINAIRQIKEHIAAGNTYQTNYTDSVVFSDSQSAYGIFEKCVQNPMNLNAYFPISPDRVLISASPERLFTVNSTGYIIAEPVKGTISRAVPDYKNKLLSSEKDRTELAMITDLLRNDISSLIKKDTLNEEFPLFVKADNVAHLYSRVWGRLKENTSFTDIVSKIFPGGSITGVPKKSTIGIISDLENRRRECYTG